MSAAADALLHVLELQPPDSSPDQRLDAGAIEVIGKALSAAATAAVGAGIIGPAALPSVRLAAGNVVSAVADALTTRLRDILVSAWNKREEIRTYGDPAKYPPNETHYVKLYEHPITWTFGPAVKVTVPPHPSFSIPLEVKLSLKVDQAVLVIQGGTPRAIEPGKGKVEATARFGGLELCKPATLDLGSLPGRLEL